MTTYSPWRKSSRIALEIDRPAYAGLIDVVKNGDLDF